MRGQRQLHLVANQETADPKVVTGELWSPRGRQMHSLHYLTPYRASSRPEVVDYCIRRYSAENDVVFDPCCGRGTALLQAALLGRIASGGDVHPLAIRISRAKLQPVGLDEIVLRLNQVDFRRPVDLTGYNEWFAPFYHPDTYRELLNLKSAIRRQRDSVNSFIEVLTLSRLHGHTAAYFSSYSFPQLALAPDHQRQLNRKRHQEPEYRAVAPRLIRRAAEVLRDGLTSDFYSQSEYHRVELGDSRSLSWVEPDSADLVVTALGAPLSARDLWLEDWFADLACREVAPRPETFLTELLGELLRVVRPEGYVIFECAEREERGSSSGAEAKVRSAIATLRLREKRFQLAEILLNEQPTIERKRPLGGEAVKIRHFLIVLRALGRGSKRRKASHRGEKQLG